MAPAPPLPGQDLLIHGGSIHTLDAGHPRPEAVLVRSGRVEALGTAAGLGGGDACVLRLPHGRALVPGLTDAHLHLQGLGRTLEQLDLRRCPSFEDVVALVEAAVGDVEEGGFVLGFGWNHEAWPDRRLPAHGRLSAVSPRHVVLLSRADGHATLANGRALELSAIGRATESPSGGEIVRDEDGEPTGLLVDAARQLLVRPPRADAASRRRFLLAAQEECLRRGLTGAHDAGVSRDHLRALEELAAEGRWSLRVSAMLEADFDADGRPAAWLAERLEEGPRRRVEPGRIAVSAVKLFLDGALGSHGAALLAPYADRPETSGLLLFESDVLVARLRTIAGAGFQGALHAIGDAAVRQAVDACEVVLGEIPREDARLRIEHAQVVPPREAMRCGALGLVASVQPLHCTSDAGMTEARLGAARSRHAHAWRRLLDAGAHLALGSDAPVEPPDPLAGLHAAVTRRRADGTPPGGWNADQALTPGEALAGFTTGAAAAAFQEGDVGSLSPGRWADFVVLSGDPLAVEAESLAGLRVESTWIAGRCVHGDLPPAEG